MADLHGPGPDGRRKFGTVSRAILQVLAEADAELRVVEVKARVERLLGGPVTASSVKNHLRRGVNRPEPSVPLLRPEPLPTSRARTWTMRGMDGAGKPDTIRHAADLEPAL